MTDDKSKAKGPGQRGQGNREGGFSFDDKGGGRGDRKGGRDGDRKGGKGREGGGASYRVVNELSGVEKALTKADFGAMKAPLAEVLKSLKPLRLQSLEQLDMGTRGKLITSLMRVMRLPKPQAEAVPEGEAAPAVEAAPEAPAAEVAPEAAPETTPTEGSAETAAPDGAPPAEAAAPAAAAPVVPAAPPVDPRVAAWIDAQYTIGLIWSSMNERDRAATAFEAAGRQPTEADLAVPAGGPPARSERPERGARPDRGARPERPAGPRVERRERVEGAPRADRPERPARKERFVRPVMTYVEPFHSSGDWKTDAQKLEEMGRTRDAARLHEKNLSFPDAVRLFEAEKDLKSALRAAAAGKLDISGYVEKLKQEEVIEALERAQAWETLMELHQKRGDFDSIAKLYERAAQFDQAALAWERAGKYAPARKAYERAKDYASANRVRDLEITKLIERGDRLGAATVLMSVGKKTEALETIKALPGPKAYSFMQKLKLHEDANAFARAELAKADAEANPLHKARWLELTGDQKGAAAVYLAANRKDKAAQVFADLGDFKQAAELAEAAGQLDKAGEFFTRAGDATNAARVQALPRPEPRPRAEQPADEPAEEREPTPAEAPVVPPEVAPAPSPTALA